MRATGRDPHATTRLLSDPWHAVIHVAWGVILLAVLAGSRDPVVVEWTAVAFGVFYLSFLVLGLVVHHPFGLMIDGPENVFHAVVGALAAPPRPGPRHAARRRERARRDRRRGASSG